MENYLVTYDVFLELANGLLERIKSNGRQYNAILCPLRGGYMISYFMSKKLSIPMLYVEISSYRER